MPIAKVADHQTARIVAAAATSVKDGMNISTKRGMQKKCTEVTLKRSGLMIPAFEALICRK